MEIVGIGEGTDMLSELERPSGFLCTTSKRYYKKLGKILIGAKVLKRIHLPTLEMLATNCAQWEFAVKEINRKNKAKPGFCKS